jgi:hypothetical protein
MKILLFLFIIPFIIPIINSIYHTKIIYTPITIPFLPHLHPIILFKKSKDNLLNKENINMMKNIYIIDYTPEEELDLKKDSKKLIKILLGKNIPGKIRLVYFENLNYNNIFEEWYNETKKSDTNKVIKKLNDKKISNIINKYDKTFNLYKNNCINFKNYFLENIDSL